MKSVQNNHVYTNWKKLCQGVLEQTVQYIEKLKCVSEDVITYGYLDSFWHFHVSKCICVDTNMNKIKIIEKPMEFMFIGGSEAGEITRIDEGCDYCFGIYDTSQKISHSKRYKIQVKEGGYFQLDGEEIHFKEGQFEFQFLVDGPETKYKPINYKR